MKVVYEARFQEIIQRFTNKRDFEDFVDNKIRDLKKWVFSVEKQKEV